MKKQILLILGITIFAFLDYSCTKEFTDLKRDNVVVIRSRSFSNLEFDDNQNPCTIKAGLSIVNTGVDEPYSFTAYTFGTSSSDTQLGERIDWSENLTLEDDTTWKEIDISTDYFYLFVKNTSSTDYGPLTVNFGNSDSHTENILLPANGVSYRVAYYKVHTDTKIRFYQQSNNSIYITMTAGVDFDFPNTKNQYVLITITGKNTFKCTTEEFPLNTLKINEKTEL